MSLKWEGVLVLPLISVRAPLTAHPIVDGTPLIFEGFVEVITFM